MPARTIMRRRARPVAAVLGALAVVAACSSSTSRPPTSPDGSAASAASRSAGSRAPATAPHSSSTASPARPAAPSDPSDPATPTTPTAPDTTSPTIPPSGPGPTEPRGGRTIIGQFRVVAFYGTAGTAQLGVLGSGTPDAVAARIEDRAAAYAPYGRPVLPAMELITTVAQGSSQADGSYSRPIPAATVRQYLDAAHRHRMLLVLDLQPGRSTFLRQAQALGDVLLDPSVGLGLDPEWKVRAPQRPGGGLIGSTDAGDVDATIGWVSRLVQAHGLPDKLVVVHEFTSSMLPDRAAITARPGVDLTFHADGFGSVAAKIAVFHRLAFPGPPTGVGFKLFLTQDARLMTPAEVMALTPRPDVVTYQ